MRLKDSCTGVSLSRKKREYRILVNVEYRWYKVDPANMTETEKHFSKGFSMSLGQCFPNILSPRPTCQLCQLGSAPECLTSCPSRCPECYLTSYMKCFWQHWPNSLPHFSAHNYFSWLFFQLSMRTFPHHHKWKTSLERIIWKMKGLGCPSPNVFSHSEAQFFCQKREFPFQTQKTTLISNWKKFTAFFLVHTSL